MYFFFSSGPGFYNLLLLFPSSSRFVIDVNLGNNSVDIAQEQIAAAIKYLGWERIYSLQRKQMPSFPFLGSTVIHLMKWETSPITMEVDQDPQIGLL